VSTMGAKFQVVTAIMSEIRLSIAKTGTRDVGVLPGVSFDQLAPTSIRDEEKREKNVAASPVSCMSLIQPERLARGQSIKSIEDTVHALSGIRHKLEKG
jgi:hypothetical protein